MVLEGKSVFGGIAIGKLSVYHQNSGPIKKRKITDAKAEIDRFMKAKEEAKKQLAELYEKALREVGEESAAIFEVHQMMLEDLN